MAKKINDITFIKNRTRVEIKSVDGWIYDLKYYTNGKESYSSQILKVDIQSRVESLEKEGFKKLETSNWKQPIGNAKNWKQPVKSEA